MMCKRCGQCCYYIFKGKRKKCKYLLRVGNTNITICRIYENRLGKVLDYDEKTHSTVRCCRREEDYRIFLGCPLNRK
jgi:hypothetical protein